MALQGHPEGMKMGSCRCRADVGLWTGATTKPVEKCDAGASRHPELLPLTRARTLDSLEQEAPLGNDAQSSRGKRTPSERRGA